MTYTEEEIDNILSNLNISLDTLIGRISAQTGILLKQKSDLAKELEK